MGGLVGRSMELAALRALLEPDGPASMVVVGEAGVGKSRLLAEAGAMADRRGWAVERIFGSAPVEAVPLGAVAHLLPARALDDDTAPFRLVRAELVRRRRGRSLLIVLDDAHHLDDGTVALVHQLVAHGEARVAAATRPAARAEAVAPLWLHEGGARLDLSRLGHDDIGELASQVLGGPVDPALVREVWELTHGNPLFVRVALHNGSDRGVVEQVEGRWTVTGTLLGEQLEDLVRLRLGGVGAVAKRVLELVVCAQPLPVELITEADGPALDELRARGLVELRSERGHAELVVAHPLYAEVLSRQLGPTGQRAVLDDLVERMPLDVGDGVVDVLRAALWVLDAGRPLDPALGERAAGVALRRGDYAVAERLARTVIESDADSFGARLVLGRAAAFAGRGREAEEVLSRASARSPAERAAVALARAHNLGFVLRRPEAAVRLLAREADAVDQVTRPQLEADRALFGAMAGDFDSARRAASAVLADRRASGPSRASATVNLLLANVMTGRLEGCDELARHGARLARRHAEDLPLAAVQVEVSYVTALVLAGRIDEAAARCRREVERTAAAGDPDPMVLGWLGMVHGLQGRLDLGIELPHRALSLFETGDPFGLWPQGVGLFVLHAGQAGAVTDDMEDLLDTATRRAASETRLAVWVGRGRTWALAARGDRAAAVGNAVETGAAAIAADHGAWGVLALHDAVRMGEAGTVRRPITDAVRHTSGARLLDLVAHHATALDEQDGDQLDEVAAGFAACGSPLLAAEAATQAARAFDRHGAPAAARRSAVRAALWARRCTQARTPMLVDPPLGVSDRELDVVASAAAGASNRSIATDLYLSVRTVENHLYAVYRKLAISGREELARLLEPCLRVSSSGATALYRAEAR